MAVLEFKLEYFKGDGGATDEGCFIQLRSEITAYCTLVSKEAYVRGQGTTSTLATNIFAVPGVVRAALQSFRVYIEKSPVFTWEETLGPVMVVLMQDTGTTGLSELLGSGITLTTENDRRGFS